jgi:hypothetical protein
LKKQIEGIPAEVEAKKAEIEAAGKKEIATVEEELKVKVAAIEADQKKAIEQAEATKAANGKSFKDKVDEAKAAASQHLKTL